MNDGLTLQVVERKAHGPKRGYADDQRPLDAIGMKDGPIQGLHAADGTAQHQAQAADAERVKQHGLGSDIVANGNQREVRPVGLAGFRIH